MKRTKQVIHIEVTSTDSDVEEMGSDYVAEFICELLESETGNWGLSYKALPEVDYYSIDQIKGIIMDLKSETYDRYAGVQNHSVRSSCYGARKACNTLLKRFLKI